LPLLFLQQIFQIRVELRSKEFGDGERCYLVPDKRVFHYNCFHFLFLIGQRQNDSTGARHFSSGSNKYIFLVVVLQVRHMFSHVAIQFFETDNVMELNDKHYVSGDGGQDKANRRDTSIPIYGLHFRIHDKIKF
jgi:hypothetical protein